MRIKAYAVYGDETKDFNHQWIMYDDCDEPDDPPTAYGMNLTPNVRQTLLTPTENCYICGRNDCDALAQHGATGSPIKGVPVHLVKCQLAGGEGVLTHTENVAWIEPERPLLTELEKKLLSNMLEGYRSVIADLSKQTPSLKALTALGVWDSIETKLDLNR